MATTPSSSTPKASADETAPPEVSLPRSTDTFDIMEHYKTKYPTRDLGELFSNARNLKPTQAPSPPPPRSAFEDMARTPISDLPPAPASYDAVGRGAEDPSSPTLDHSHICASTDAELVTVPRVHCNLPSANIQQTGPAGVAEQLPKYPADRISSSPQSQNSTVSASAPPLDVPDSEPSLPLRLVFLGPLKMIRGRCMKNTTLRPILDWVDHYMGEELHTPVHTDGMISNIVYAVNIPMSDKVWLDWTKVLAVFPYAAAWQETLKRKEPFDQVTENHHTRSLFIEGEGLQSLMADLV